MGPLQGFRIVEIAGIGPAPFAAMMLSDMGAEVLRIDRIDRVVKENADSPSLELMNRNRMSVAIDLKNSDGVSAALRLVEQADALLEGFRPGVMERLGLGPDPCMKRNPRLVYGRMTGWGQDGPLAGAAGHDINYIALAGVLHHIGRAGEPPVPPLNLVGDFGGGGMLLAFGVVCALLEASRSGRGQVVDAAMVDGAAILMTMFHGFLQLGWLSEERGANLLDSGAYFYETYETKDGKYVAVGALEPEFHKKLIELTGLDAKEPSGLSAKELSGLSAKEPSGLSAEELPHQLERGRWPEMKQRLAAIFKTKTRDEWCAQMEGTDACFAPVLTMRESMAHPHMRHRNTYVQVDGVSQPAPAPRFSRTSAQIARPPAQPGQHTQEALESWGFSRDEIAELLASKAIA